MSSEITIPAVYRAGAASLNRETGWRGQVHAQVDLHDGLIPTRIPLAVTLDKFWTIDEAIWAARSVLSEIEG